MLYPVELQTQLIAPGEKETGGQRDSKPMERFHGFARFLAFHAGKCALTATRVKSDIAVLAQNYAVPVSEFVRISVSLAPAAE